MSKTTSPKLCLIDASGYIHRAYHALPVLTTSKGEPIHAIFGFSRMMSKVLKAEKPDYLAVCFDTPKPTFRHDMYKEYKGTRTETEPALISQLPLVEELAQAWGLPCVKKDGFEADDVIATLARLGEKTGCQVLIMSGDKDILQLVNDKISVRDEIRKTEYNTEKVKEKYGIFPNQLVDYFSLMGDKVDNVVGVPGVGDKTASKLILENENLESLYENMKGTKPALQERLIQFKENVFTNRTLVKLEEKVPLNVTLKDLVVRQPTTEILTSLLKRLEFRGDFFGLEEKVAVGEANASRQTNVVFTENDLNELRKDLTGAKLVSYDLETDSADQHNCHIVGVALSVRKDKAWYIPVGHSYIGVPTQLSWDKVKVLLKEFLGNPSIVKAGQNIKFDNTILERFGVKPVGPFFDTMVAVYCLDPGRNTYGLKDLAAEFLGESMTRIDALIGKGKDKTMADVPIEQAAPYAAADAEVVVRLSALFSERLKNEGLEGLFTKLEMPLVEVLEAMEAAGIVVDADYLRQVGKKFEERRKALEKEVFALAGEEFLLSSPLQLSKILFEKLKLPALKKTKTGYSTNEEVLKKLSEKHPICEKIIDYRELAKLISTYVDSLLELMNPVTGRVHTSFHQTGTATGRLSSTEPNLQNIPIRSDLGREIRRAFSAPAGSVLLSADYSQVDLRSLAHMSEDPVLIETFKAGGDIHTSTAAQIFHVAPQEVTSEMRRRAKAINFGIVYGQQAWGLSQGLGIELKEAQEFINKYFERYSGVKKWIEKTLEDARKNGFVTTLAGRRRKLPDINSDNQSIRGFAERIATNTPIQGTSADIIKAAMINVFDVFRRKGTKARMLVQVHDELLFEVPESELPSVTRIVTEGMEQAVSLKVPLIVDLKMGKNWNDMGSLAKEKAA